MVLSVSQRDAKKNALLAFPAAGCTLYVGEVIVAHCFQLQFVVGREQAEGDNRCQRGAWPDEDQEEDSDRCDDGETGQQALSTTVRGGPSWLVSVKREVSVEERSAEPTRRHQSNGGRGTCEGKSRTCCPLDIHWRSRLRDGEASPWSRRMHMTATSRALAGGTKPRSGESGLKRQRSGSSRPRESWYSSKRGHLVATALWRRTNAGMGQWTVGLGNKLNGCEEEQAGATASVRKGGVSRAVEAAIVMADDSRRGATRRVGYGTRGRRMGVQGERNLT